ncbi:MAG TPA: ABC-F family ATP-binding cassette domain-containing protein [Cytophagaceae bacterium]|jgi:ATP-binding cassette subfamily F protein uup
MNFLSAENISKNFSDKWLFKDINLGVSQGQKVALVGANGTGKTTLLNVLAGKIKPDSGLVTFRNGISVGYMDQNPVFNESNSVMQELFSSGAEVIKAIAEYEKCLSDAKYHDGLQDAMEKMDALGAWDYDSRVKEIISKMGLENMDQKISTLSGGQRKRVAMAKVLIEDPDFLIMDEPTNHLDLETIEWLENFLGNKNSTLLLVTHDRYFLDSVATEIIELENGNIYKYKGDYSYFIEKKAEREAAQDAEVDKARNLMRKELEWMRRQPKARGTKQKARIDAFHDLKEKASQKRVDQKLELSVKTSRLGGKVIEVEKINKSFGDKKIVDNFTYIFKKLDRIGIIGKNGVGKTTFLNMLTLQDKPDNGKVDVGLTTVFGYFSQSNAELDLNQRVIESVKEVAEMITLGNGEIITASAFLQHFLFPPSMQYTPISKLSGGEKKRLQLLKVLIKNPNFLILDEPTNDLDLVTLSVLEEFLTKFGGCLIIVSHDRYFMDKCCDHLFVFEGDGKIKDFPGNYTEFRIWQDEQEEEKALLAKKPVVEAPPIKTIDKNKLSFQEKKEYETLEKEIDQLEKKKEGLVKKLDSISGNHSELQSVSNEIDQIISQIEDKSMRWLELGEKI